MPGEGGDTVNEVPQPIINTPFEKPAYYWHIEKGKPPEKIAGRRPASYFFRVPEHAARGRAPRKQFEMYEETEQGQEYLLDIANLIRQRIEEWGERDYLGATRVTRDLLRLWLSAERNPRLFFAQREAALAAILLTEGPDDLRQGIKIPQDAPGPKAQEQGYRAFERRALKMATGSGKTVVMGMLSAWSILNKVASPQDKRFSDTVLVICPNVTIRERLQELDPALGRHSLYAKFDLVPWRYMEDLRKGEVYITNWHNLERREISSVNGVSAKVVKRGMPVTTVKNKTIDGKKQQVEETRYYESDAAWLKRVLGGRKGRSQSILVFNDEAHHAYRRGDSDKQVVLDEELAKRNAREATVWIEGLDRLNKGLGSRSNGIRLCVDFSATPFYIQGSGNEVGKPFDWIISDFSLLESIESGLVKIPQLPTADITGAGTPSYFNVWRWCEEQAKADGMSGPMTPDLVLHYAAQPITQLAADWDETFALWDEQSRQGFRKKTPPVFIIVCRDTALAKEVYEWIAEGKGNYGKAPAAFRNQAGREPATVRIDSKVAEDIEAGGSKDEFKRLRYVMDTVGKDRWPGGRVPEEYAEIVRKHNDKALDVDSLEWIDENKPPGRDIRCIVSVAMLTEGWDANTVTHIVGLRPFGSQLLCEQVVGRALRRTSYGTDEQGFFTEETAKVFGVPFELIPFKTTGGEGPPPSPPDNEIYAVPEKVEYEISFPVVEGYQDPGIVDVVMAWDRVATITLDPMDIPDSTLVRGLAAADGRLAAYGPGQPMELNLEDWRKRIRPQQVAFDLALALTGQWLKEKGDQIPSHVLFPRMLAFARRYLDKGVEYRGSRAASDVALSPYYGRALAALFQGLSAKDRAGSAELPLIPSGGAGLRSTADVRFFTGREVWQVEKCHLNAMVGDTRQWEQSAAYTLDRHPGVLAWVKNERLGFHIPYPKAAGIVRAYNADFIIRLDIELNLILEIKGRASDDAKIKEAAARRWVDAVNRDGRFGLWRYEIVYDPAELSKRLDEVCAAKQDRTLERV